MHKDYYDSADYVLYNGKIHSLDRSNTVYSSIAVKDNKIIFLGKSDNEAFKFVNDKTVVLNLKGKMVMPSFTDAHMHIPGNYLAQYDIDLSDLTSLEDYIEAIKNYIIDNPNEAIIYGEGWDIKNFNDRNDRKYGPNKEYLNEIETDKPIVLYSGDRHTAWLNDAALNKFKITKYTAIDIDKTLWNNIVKGPDGELWGTIKEDAMNYIPTKIYSKKQYFNAFDKFQKDMHSLGITNVNSIYVNYMNGLISADIFKQLILEGKLKLRVSYASNICHKRIEDGKIIDFHEQLDELIEERNEMNHLTEYFKITAAKIFIDGVVEAMTAYLNTPYEFAAGKGYDYFGENLWDNNKDDYKELIYLLNKNNFQVHNHAIGDGATKFILDAFEEIGKDIKPQCRNIITHLQLVRKQDIKRIKDLNIIADIQPYWHVKYPNYWNELNYLPLGERAEYEYPLASFIDENICTSGSSDCPVTTIPNPLLAIQRGATRNLCDSESYGFSPLLSVDDEEYLLNKCERTSVLDMVKLFTINGAYATFRENEIGTLEVSKKADFIVLSKNIFELDPINIHKSKVLLTFFDGEIVYCDENYGFFFLS